MLALAGCGFEFGTSYSAGVDALWDAESVVSSADGLYARMPQTGGLVLLAPGAEPVFADVGAGHIVGLVPDQSGGRLAAILDRTRCVAVEERDLRGVQYVNECPSNAEKVTEREIAQVQGGVLGAGVSVPAHVNTVSWMPDGSRAVGWMDADQPVSLSGVVDPSSVEILDLAAGTATPVRLGFVATDLLFSDDGNTALALSRSEVAVVNVGVSPPVLEVVFPLTLDVTAPVTPTGVDLTPDGAYAMVTVAGRSDLYVLDLVNHSVNLLTLSGTPSSLMVLPDLDRTVVAFANKAVVDVIDHDVFDVTEIPINGAVTTLTRAGDRLIGASPNGRAASLVDVMMLKSWSYRLENPILEMRAAPGGEYAVALTRAEGGNGAGVGGLYDAHPGLEVLDLRADANGEVRGDSSPYILESEGLGLAFSADAASLEVLVLQDGLDYLFALDLYTGLQREVQLAAPPVALGVLPSGTFWITQEAGLGLVSFLEPGADAPVEVSGFATHGMFEQERLVEDGQ